MYQLWVLVIVSHVYMGSVVTSIEFNSEARCESSKMLVIAATHRISFNKAETLCVEK